MEKGVPIRSISRAISVLQMVNRHGSLSMMEIARRCGMPYPTTYRIVYTLIHEGLVEQEPARKHYRATALVQSLSHGYQPASRLVTVAAPLIRNLTKEMGWPVSLTVRVGSNMVVCDSTHAETSLTFDNYYPGYTLPLLDCASGRVCLAHLPQDELEDLRRWASVALASEERSFFYSDELLARIREQSYASQAWGRHNLTPGKTSSIAVPILVDGQFKGALTLIYFAASMKESAALERYVAPLQRTARAVAGHLEAGESEGEDEAGLLQAALG